MIRCEIIGAIDDISMVTMESDLSVIQALINQIDKSIELSESSYIQEGGIMDEVREKSKKDSNKFISFISFLPRLIIALFNAIKGLFSKKDGKDSDEVKKAGNAVKESSEKARKAVDELKDKDENWFQRHPKVTLAGGLVLTGAAAYALVKTIKNAESGICKVIKDVFVDKILPFFNATGEKIKNTKIVCRLSLIGMKIYTTLRIDRLVNFIKDAGSVFKIIKFTGEKAHEVLSKTGITKAGEKILNTIRGGLNKATDAIDKIRSNGELVSEEVNELTVDEVVDSITGVEKEASILSKTLEGCKSFVSNLVNPAKDLADQIAPGVVDQFEDANTKKQIDLVSGFSKVTGYACLGVKKVSSGLKTAMNAAKEAVQKVSETETGRAVKETVNNVKNKAKDIINDKADDVSKNKTKDVNNDDKDNPKNKTNETSSDDASERQNASDSIDVD